MRIITAIGAPFIALAIILALAVSAIGHTPTVGASCDTLLVYAEGTSYDAGDTNTVTVTLDDDTKTDTFPTDGRVELAIPEDGLPHKWTATVETTNPDPAFDAHDSGTITCGTPPPTVKRASFRVVNYCPPAGPRVEGRHNVKSIWRTHPAPKRYVFRAVAKPGALFANGKATTTKVVHVKPLCGHTGSR